MLAPCGIYCGLCTKYQSKAPSRCPGCRISDSHNYCSIYACSTKRRYVTCVECGDYPCERFARRKWGSDYVSTGALANLDACKGGGRQALLRERKKRRLLVERLIDSYNDGRSITFYCRTCSILPVGEIERAIKEAERVFSNDGVAVTDLKARARILRGVMQSMAEESGVALK